MTIYTGLRVSNNLGDVNNVNESLRNLGLDRNDLNHIRGLSDVEGFGRLQLHMLSGLDVDQEKQTYQIKLGLRVLNAELQNEKDFKQGLDFDIRANNQFRAGSIKYTYLDEVSHQLVKSDISTSRVSSWSQFVENGPIFYGADVLVVGDNNNDAILKLNDLMLSKDFTPKRFEAEQPTDKVVININGTDREVFAMRNIPFSFYGSFSKARLQYKVTVDNPPIVPTVLFYDLDQDTEVISNGARGAATNVASFNTRFATDRRIDIYYRPDKILELEFIKSNDEPQPINMDTFPAVQVKNIQKINVASNLLSVLPDFFEICGGNISGHTSSLVNINVAGNPLSQSGIVANVQLNAKIPSSVEVLDISGAFRDSTPIDLRTLKVSGTNTTGPSALKSFKMQGDRPLTGIVWPMIGGFNAVAPRVNPLTIESYNIRRQRFGILPYEIKESLTLKSLDCYANYELNSIETSSGSVGVSNTITLDSPELVSINLSYNRVAPINVSGKANLVEYYHTNNNSYANVDISNFFTGCVDLKILSFNDSQVTGNISSTFNNLPSLGELRLTNTRMSGRMNSGTFTGTTNLRIFTNTGSLYTSTVGVDNFFGNSYVPIDNPTPGSIGSAYGGGFYSGSMEDGTGNEFYLVVADNSATTNLPRYDSDSGGILGGAYSNIEGDDNTAVEAASNDTDFRAAKYADAYNVSDSELGLTYNDWYIPSIKELEVLYRMYKPTNADNDITQGNNEFALTPTYNATYTNTPTKNPVQTTISGFAPGGAQAFETVASTEATQNGDFSGGLTGWKSINSSSPLTLLPSGYIKVTQDFSLPFRIDAGQTYATAYQGTGVDPAGQLSGHNGIVQTLDLDIGAYVLEAEIGANSIHEIQGSEVKQFGSYNHVSENIASFYTDIPVRNIDPDANTIALPNHVYKNGMALEYDYDETSFDTQGLTTPNNFALYNLDPNRRYTSSSNSPKILYVKNATPSTFQLSVDSDLSTTYNLTQHEITYNYTISGTNSSTDYVFDISSSPIDRNGAITSADPAIDLLHGDVVNFNVSALGGSHPLEITDGAGNVIISASAATTVTFDSRLFGTPSNANAETYYYQCSTHPASMKGTITVYKRDGVVTFGPAMHIEFSNSFNDTYTPLSTSQAGNPQSRINYVLGQDPHNCDADASAANLDKYGITFTLSAGSNPGFVQYGNMKLFKGDFDELDGTETPSELNSDGSANFTGYFDLVNNQTLPFSPITKFVIQEAGKYHIRISAYNRDFEVKKIIIRGKSGVVWSSTVSSQSALEGLGVDFTSGEVVSFLKEAPFVVRPVRRVLAQSQSNAEQQGTSSVFQPVGAKLSTFTLHGEGKSKSSGTNIRGKLPNLQYLTNIYTFELKNTQLQGTLPDFSNSSRLNKLDLIRNNFGGTLSLNNNSVSQVILDENSFQLISSLNLPNVWLFSAKDNFISGVIPSFNNCRKVQKIQLSNNVFTGYTSGSIQMLTKLTELKLQNNNLTRGAAIAVLEDLKINWENNTQSSRRVTVNLTGNPRVSESDLASDTVAGAFLEFLRSKNWTINLNS